MEAPTYWLMVLARIIQGISSSIIWVVGLALLWVIHILHHCSILAHTVSIRCDTAAESIVGSKSHVDTSPYRI